MVRVALSGVGMIAKVHLGAYAQIPGVQVTALHDVRKDALTITSLDSGGNIQAAGGAVDLSGAGKYSDFDALLRVGGFDYVDICAPTFVHADQTIRALRAGYHVFCEKPMTLSNQESERVLEAQREAGMFVSVGQCLRFWPAYVELKRIVDSGDFGRVRAAEFSRYSPRPGWSEDNWFLERARSGGAALDLHVHDVDLVLWLFGRPRTVRSVGTFEKDGAISHISTVYGFDGISVSSTAGWTSPRGFPFNMRAFVALERATVVLDFARDPVFVLYNSDGTSNAVALPEGDGYRHELAAFAKNVATGRPPDVNTAETAAAAVRLALREIESAGAGRELSVE